MAPKTLAENRWNRKRESLPNLSLKYPSNSEEQELADLAKVDSPSVFGSSIRQLILDAHLLDISLKSLSIPEVKSLLQKIENQAQQLATILREIDVSARGSKQHAGRLLENELWLLELGDKKVLIPDYVQLLDALRNASDKASKAATAKRGPRGAGGNPAFDRTIEMLLTAAWLRRGGWTVYKKADQTWGGTLLKALHILKPYLPDGFFPTGELGRSVVHIKRKFTKRHK